jgi:hypothetical protein
MPIRNSAPTPADGLIELARAAKARLRDGIERAQRAALALSEGDTMSSKESFADKLKREGMKDLAEGKLKRAEGKVEEQWGKAQKKAGELLDPEKDDRP